MYTFLAAQRPSTTFTCSVVVPSSLVVLAQHAIPSFDPQKSTKQMLLTSIFSSRSTLLCSTLPFTTCNNLLFLVLLFRVL